jgi:hypothetical protein
MPTEQDTDSVINPTGGVLLFFLQVIYTVLIVPISIARFASYAGAQVPVAVTFLADFIFALGGRLVQFYPCATF